ncbi:MAG: bacterial transcriptional activator domain-containing protein [Terracidiphilus sp.]|jgi:predicted Zn-dependent protease
MNKLEEDDLRRVMEVIRHAVEFAENNDSAFATQILTAVVEEFPGLAIGHSYLGWILSRSGRHREAIEHGRVAVRLEPESERVSLLLFRVLWGAGERGDAFEEMKRFMAVGHSDEYSKLMEEWTQIAES